MAALEQAAALVNSGDTGFVLTASITAMACTCAGAAVFAAGHVKADARAGVILQSLSLAAIAALVWVIAGYSIGFGAITNGFFAAPRFGLNIEPGMVRGGTALPESVFAVLRMAFAMAAAAILVGAWAGRARLSWVMGFAIFWSLLVLAPIAHWLWGGGWLRTQIGAIDYAGGLVVHLSAGVSALVTALLIGPRLGFSKDAQSDETPTETHTFTAAGAGLLAIGWLALNAASALAANHNAAAAILSVICASFTAALAWMALENAGRGSASIGGIAKGMIAGIAAISPSSVYVSPLAAILIGLAASVACFGIERRIAKGLGIDDSASIFALFGVGGMLGSLLLAVFLSAQWGGTGYFGQSAMFSQFAAQAIAAGAVAVWSAVGTAIAVLAVSIVCPMRISEADEAGLSEGPD